MSVCSILFTARPARAETARSRPSSKPVKLGPYARSVCTDDPSLVRSARADTHPAALDNTGLKTFSHSPLHPTPASAIASWQHRCAIRAHDASSSGRNLPNVVDRTIRRLLVARIHSQPFIHTRPGLCLCPRMMLRCTAFSRPSARCVYTCVVEISACPSSSLHTAQAAPCPPCASRNCAAAVRARVLVRHLHQVPNPLPRKRHPPQRKEQPCRILPRRNRLSASC